jgi:tetratricopeptide (TPR) repeat protein
VLFPFAVLPLFNLGMLRYRQGRYLEAARYLHGCFTRGFAVHQIVRPLVKCYRKVGDLENETRVYTEYVAREPGNLWGLKNLGAALLKTGDIRKAKIVLRQASHKDPRDTKILKNLKLAELTLLKKTPTGSPNR